MLDYVLAALKGMRADDYVANSISCVNDTKNFQIDAERWNTKWETRQEPLSPKELEDIIFNGTAALSGYLPDSIYYCYFIPQTSRENWQSHYETFESI